VIKDYNILVSCLKGRENDACAEIWYFFSEMGDRSVKCERTGVPGLVAVKTSLNPFEAIRMLKERAMEDPWQFRYTLKYVPLEVVVPSKIEEIEKSAAELAKDRIKESETFRITVRKRYTTLSRTDIIEAIAKHINRKVNLENPDWIIQVEVVGKWTGISVIKPDDILSIEKLRK